MSIDEAKISAITDKTCRRNNYFIPDFLFNDRLIIEDLN